MSYAAKTLVRPLVEYATVICLQKPTYGNWKGAKLHRKQWAMLQKLLSGLWWNMPLSSGITEANKWKLEMVPNYIENNELCCKNSCQALGGICHCHLGSQKPTYGNWKWWCIVQWEWFVLKTISVSSMLQQLQWLTLQEYSWYAHHLHHTNQLYSRPWAPLSRTEPRSTKDPSVLTPSDFRTGFPKQ